MKKENGLIEKTIQERIASLTGKGYSEGVISLVKSEYDLHGPFWTSMWQALRGADEANLELLARAFPEHVAALRAYRSPASSLGSMLRADGIMV